MKGAVFFPVASFENYLIKLAPTFGTGLSYFISKEVISHFDGEATDMCSCFKVRGLLASFFKG